MTGKTGKTASNLVLFSHLVLGPIGFGGCTDNADLSEQKAVGHVTTLAQLTDKDVQEVKRGLPRGAAAIAAAWATNADPSNPRPTVCRKLEPIRNADTDLMVAKSTFFALADPQGTVLCSDQEPDVLEGKALMPAFPDLSKVAAGEVVQTTGAMPAIGVKPNVPDREWVSAAPVRGANDIVRGMYVSGWSYKRFAYHLEETLKHDLVVEAIQAKKDKIKQPLIYVFVFTGPTVFGAPVTPQLNAEALEKLDLPAKTASGSHHQQIQITGRKYGLAATRTPSLGPDTGIAILRSEI